jgi:hypothetical protein
MKNQSMLMSAAFLISACATTAPHREAGPPFSVQGLRLRIADVGCSVTEGGSLTGYVEPSQRVFDLKLQIKNDSGRVARFSERRIRLVDSSAPAAPPLTPDQAEVVSVFPGETTELPVRFTTGGRLDCSHDFNLLLADAVQLVEPPAAALSTISIPVPR